MCFGIVDLLFEQENFVIFVVERRRRDKINNWIQQLGKLVPDCQAETKQGDVRIMFKIDNNNGRAFVHILLNMNGFFGSN